MKANGLVTIKMEMESRSGQMVRSILVNGLLDILKDKAFLLKQMVMFLKGSGIKERLMVFLVTNKKGPTDNLVTPI